MKGVSLINNYLSDKEGEEIVNEISEKFGNANLITFLPIKPQAIPVPIQISSVVSSIFTPQRN